MCNKCFLILFIVGINFSVSAQDFFKWNAYTSYRTINSSTFAKDGDFWITTNGGLALIKNQQISSTLTTIEGLSRLDGNTIYYESENDKLFVGYVDGLIDVIDPKTLSVITIRDIYRNSIFTSKSINKISSDENSLLVGTDFGIVEFDLINYFVKNTYLKLGNFPTATPVTDLFVANDSLFVGTSVGISISALDGSYGVDDWENFDNLNGFVSQEVVSLAYFNDRLYASSNEQNYIYRDDNWSINTDFGSNPILDYEIQMGNLVALSKNSIFIKNQGSGFSNKNLIGKTALSLSQNIKSGGYFFGTFANGLGFLSNDLSDSYITPEGPYLNVFNGLNFDGGTLIASSTEQSSRVFDIDRAYGFYTFKDGIWQNYNSYLNEELRVKNFRLSFTSLITDDYYYFGSWGSGITRLNKETKMLKVFDETNTTIRGWSGAALNYPVMIGLDEDSNGDVWAVSRFAEVPLYRQTPGDDNWQAYDPSIDISNSDLYEGLFIDSYDQKWIPLQNVQTTGTGLLVLNTGDKENGTDDVGIKLQSEPLNGNLPDNKVNSIIEDQNGEVWIGTSRGIAKFIFPELLIEGSSQERNAQWLINEDTSAVSRFLLRDVNATAMAVNAANKKWIGSANQGVWLLNAEGSRIEKRFTKENSPLFSNTIKSIAVNDETGEVFFATDLGLISYQDVPRKAVSEMEKLKVYPNPFSYEQNQEILIEGLSEKAIIRILAVDGTVVNRFESTGGRVSWNGLDFNNNKLGTGIYYVVALSESGDSKGIGKVVIVR